MKILALITLFLLFTTNALSAPTEQDRQKALKLMYVLTSDQELHFIETSNYETTLPRWNDGFVYYSCAYSNFRGKGYVATISKIEKGKAWVIERHFGDDPTIEDNISGYWTCQNCTGEKYEIHKKANEHGLCNL